MTVIETIIQDLDHREAQRKRQWVAIHSPLRDDEWALLWTNAGTPLDPAGWGMPRVPRELREYLIALDHLREAEQLGFDVEQYAKMVSRCRAAWDARRSECREEASTEPATR